jgi:hypothetical protein
MNIKYGEISVIQNTNEESFISYIGRKLGCENSFTNKDEIIILFEDETIYNTKDIQNNNSFKFSSVSLSSGFPIYFDINKQTPAFYKKPIKDAFDKSYLNFTTIFKNYSKYKSYKDSNKLDVSRYNIIYEKLDNNDIFSIVKIKSNEEKPRFILAYDSNYFDKNDIIYLIDCILKSKYHEKVE